MNTTNEGHQAVISTSFTSAETIGLHVAAHVPDLQRRVRNAPSWRLARLAYRVSEDGIEELQRDDLAQHYRRHGLTRLARAIRNAPLDRACVVFEGEPETRVISIDPAWGR